MADARLWLRTAAINMKRLAARCLTHAVMLHSARCSIKTVSFLILLFQPSLGVKHHVFAHIQDRDMKPLRVDMGIPGLHSGIECVLACYVTDMCVGGRFIRSMCELTTDGAGVMPLRSMKEEAHSKDFVFGVFCNPEFGYTETKNAFIMDHNDRKINSIKYPDTGACQMECSKRLWCLTADITRNRCYLSGVNRHNAKLKYSRSSKKIHFQKNCFP